MAKRRHFLLAIIRKANEEFTLKEAIPEAVVGFVYAVYLRRNGLEDEHGQWEIIIEAILYGFLLPIIGFIFRAFFTAPGEVVKETLESRKEAEIDPKSIYPSIVTILLVVCSALVGILILNIQRPRQTGNTISIASKETQKPLPTKTVPRPEPAPPESSTNIPQLATFETRTEMYSVDSKTNTNFTSLIEKLKAKKDADTEAQQRQIYLDRIKWWNSYLPYYRRSLVVLRDALHDEAKKTGDGISQSDGYLLCLSSNMDQNVGQIEVATIGLQKNTNMSFMITVAANNSGSHRQLIISCTGGTLEMEPGWLDQFHSTIHIKNPDFDYHVDVPIAKANDQINESINNIMDAQRDFINTTNTPNQKMP